MALVKQVPRLDPSRSVCMYVIRQPPKQLDSIRACVTISMQKLPALLCVHEQDSKLYSIVLFIDTHLSTNLKDGME